MELKGPDTDYQCPGGIIGFDNCSNAGYGSAEIIRPADVKGKKKPDSSRPYLCFLAERMNVLLLTMPCTICRNDRARVYAGPV